VDSLRIAVICLGAVLLVTLGMARAQEPGDDVRLPIEVRKEVPVSQVVVQPGDHLWRISTHRLTSVFGREPGDSEVSPYWREVIELNREGLRSGDPDLIYPGEMITLPPAPNAGR
jgi:nucleoid-associated protein YgaU